MIIATSSHCHFVEGLSFCLELALLRTLKPTLKKGLQDGEDQDRVQGCTDMNLNPGLVRYVALGKVFLIKAQFPHLHNGDGDNHSLKDSYGGKNLEKVQLNVHRSRGHYCDYCYYLHDLD